MPDAAPVTSATLPLSVMRCFLPLGALANKAVLPYLTGRRKAMEASRASHSDRYHEGTDHLTQGGPGPPRRQAGRPTGGRVAARRTDASQCETRQPGLHDLRDHE